MILQHKELLNKPVFTTLGQPLGRLASFRVETDSQSIVDYYITPDRSLANLFHNQLIINRGQIIDILPDKIIVADNFSRVQKNPPPKSKKTAPELIAE